ncbi:MAG: tripartite tricarboxylate transporter substrate binding protein [Betaproteobacteria bacterium]|nr:tripartite tricarboxylate transporter substrate binding protein [Betaproteobacteria bacterium]
MRNWIGRVVGGIALLVVAAIAVAQYPAKPITIIVPFPTATASDLIARILATELSSAMGQPVVVQNRPGGNSAIGAAAVASAPPDGYTLLLATAGTVALPALVKLLPYDTLQDLVPISTLSRFALFLYINAELPIRTLPELFDYARANPGKLNYATGNPVGIAASAQLFSLAGNLRLVHVPYKGEPAGVLDLAANRVQLMFSTPSSADTFVKTGKVRVLATNLPQRAPFAPDVPSVNEFIPKFSMTAWAGLMGPKGIPKEVVDRLSREVMAALNRPQTKEKFDQLQFMGNTSTPEEFSAFFKEQVDLYSRVLREAGVQPE